MVIKQKKQNKINSDLRRHTSQMREQKREKTANRISEMNMKMICIKQSDIEATSFDITNFCKYFLLCYQIP